MYRVERTLAKAGELVNRVCYIGWAVGYRVRMGGLRLMGKSNTLPVHPAASIGGGIPGNSCKS